MPIVSKLVMLSLAVSDMPKSKEFYVDKLGFKVAKDYRQDDKNWWVSLTSAENGASITLTTNHENMKPGTMKLYLATSDVTKSHQKLKDRGVKVEELKDNLHGPGSGVKWFDLNDPDGNQVLVVETWD